MKTSLRRFLEVSALVSLYCITSYACYEAGYRQEKQAAVTPVVAPVEDALQAPAEAPVVTADEPVKVQDRGDHPLLLINRATAIQAKATGPTLPEEKPQPPAVPPVITPAPVCQPQCQYYYRRGRR